MSTTAAAPPTTSTRGDWTAPGGAVAIPPYAVDSRDERRPLSVAFADAAPALAAIAGVAALVADFVFLGAYPSPCTLKPRAVRDDDRV
jgi:hypothetical protein